MTSWRYLLGLVLTIVAIAPVWVACRRWSDCLLPSLGTSQARLVEAVAVLGSVELVGEVLGSAGQLRVATLTAVLAVLGGVAWYGARSFSRSRLRAARVVGDRREAVIERVYLPPWTTPVSFGAVAVVVAEWSTRVAQSIGHGMGGVDTLWYHMPFAARFAQQGSTWPLHYVDTEPVTVFFPANSELFHGVGIVFMGSDVLSPFLNMGWLALALLGAWCVGSAFGVGPIAVAGVSMLLGTPGLVSTQPGEAYTDIVTFALLLASIALLFSSTRVSATEELVCIGAAAIPAGIALGTKFTAVAPVVALTLGICAVSGTRGRWRRLASWGGVVVLLGGYWYLRNLVATGNPLPSFHLKLGPLVLHSPSVSTPSSTVAHFLLNGSAWRQFFLPGFRLSLGPAWWAIVALAVGGLVLACLSRGDAMLRMVAIVGVLSGIAFVFTPQFLTIYGAPYYFVYNLRYSFAALIVGLVVFPVTPRMREQRRLQMLLVAFVVVLAVTQLDGSIWPSRVFSDRFANPATAIDSLIGVAAGVATFLVGMMVLLRRGRRGRGLQRWTRRASATWALVGVVAAVCGFAVLRLYLDHRYEAKRSTPLGPVYAWAQQVHGARIAVVGSFSNLQYPLYGRDLSNYVQFAGIRGSYGSYSPIESCTEWKRWLQEGNYDYVLISTNLVKDPRAPARSVSEGAWTLTAPASQTVFSSVRFVGTGQHPGYLGLYVFRLRRSAVNGMC